MIYLGRVEKPHGLKGGLRIRLFGGYGTPGVPVGTRLFMEREAEVTVSRCTERGESMFNITFREIRSREEAEGYRNADLYITPEEADERLEFVPLYMFSGFTIVSRGNEVRVADVEPSGRNPLLLVETDDRKFYVPVAMVMTEGDVDWDERVIRLDLPEGLEDLPL